MCIIVGEGGGCEFREIVECLWDNEWFAVLYAVIDNTATYSGSIGFAGEVV